MIHEGLELPDGWKLETLATTAALVKVKVDPIESPDAPYIGLEHVEANTMRILGHGRGSDVKSAKTKFSAGDVLYGKLRPYLNKVARPDFDGICSTDFLVFTESPRLDPGYLASYLNQLWVADQAHQLSSGVELPRVDWTALSKLPIAFPEDKSTQRRIAHRLALIRSSRSSATNRFRSARRSVEQFRRAVLGAACSGRLTSEWRQNNPITDPAESIVAAREARRRRPAPQRQVAKPTEREDLPAHWCWTSIDALVDVATGATPLRSRSDYYGGTIPWVTSGAVNAGVITTAAETITELAIKETNAKVFQAGTLLVAMYGEGQTRGRVAELGIAAATNQAVAALLFDDQSANLRPYLRLFLLENYERMRQRAFGGVQPNLSLGVIRDTPIPMPPAAEQIEILRQVDQLLILASGIQVKLEQADLAVGRIGQAILAKALRGELLNGHDHVMAEP